MHIPTLGRSAIFIRRNKINDVAHSNSSDVFPPSTPSTMAKKGKADDGKISIKGIQPCKQVRVRVLGLLLRLSIALFTVIWANTTVLLLTSPSLELIDLLELGSGGVKEALMVIAVYPNSPIKYDVIWSQLECFAGAFDQIIISAPIEFRDNVTQFVREVNNTMPELDSRIDAEFYVNDRYDAGLWCDALLKGNALKKIAAENNQEGTYVGGHSKYNRFLLINDSIMAVKKSNEFLEALTEKNASLISLSYWGNKEKQQERASGNSTNYVDPYWLESPLRAFSLEGIQIYADKVCSLGKINAQRDCPHLYADKRLNKKHGSGARKNKQCIVEKTEINVVDHYTFDKVHGLFPGDDGLYNSWSNNFTFWANMRDEMSFPVLKVNSGHLVKEVIKRRPGEIDICTAFRGRDSSS